MDTGLPIRRVRDYLADLAARGRIVRDGAWIFVCGYFKRQPKGARLLDGVEFDVRGCSSVPVLEAFAQRYPHLCQWSIDRLATVTRPSGDHVSNSDHRAVQSRAVQSRAEQGANEPLPADKPPATASASPHTDNGGPSAAMREVLATLERCPAFRPSLKLREEKFWLHEINANPDIDVLAQTLKAQAWLTAHPRQSKRDVVRFLHAWFANPLARSGA